MTGVPVREDFCGSVRVGPYYERVVRLIGNRVGSTVDVNW